MSLTAELRGMSEVPYDKPPRFAHTCVFCGLKHREVEIADVSGWIQWICNDRQACLNRRRRAATGGTNED